MNLLAVSFRDAVGSVQTANNKECRRLELVTVCGVPMVAICRKGKATRMVPLANIRDLQVIEETYASQVGGMAEPDPEPIQEDETDPEVPSQKAAPRKRGRPRAS